MHSKKPNFSEICGIVRFYNFGRSYHIREKTQIEMARAHNKINRTRKDDPTRHGTSRGEKNERQTEKKRWEGNNSDWTGLKLGEALRNVENSEGWRKVVARSSLMPQRSFRQRNK